MKWLILALELASLLCSGCAAKAVGDYRNDLAGGLSLAKLADGTGSPAPDPLTIVNKPKRAACPVCHGSGRVLAPDTSSMMDCTACEPPRALPTSSACKCDVCSCRMVPVMVPAVPAPPAKPVAARVEPPRTITKPKPTATVAVPKKVTYSNSGSCANGQCSGSRTFVRRRR